jgi:hypothetical protein
LDSDARGSSHRVVVYHAKDCHLCERALEVVRRVARAQELEPTEVDISGDPELERRYRELIPVVEVDGERAFTYFVHEAALRRKLGAQSDA